MRRIGKTRKYRKGGAIIGEGQQGIAFLPSLKCNNSDPNSRIPLNEGAVSPFSKKRKTYVTKITSANVAQHELNLSSNILATDSYGQFTAPTIKKCRAARNQINTNYAKRLANINVRGLDTLSFSRYRGKPIEYYLEKAYENNIDINEILNILTAVCNLILITSRKLNGEAGISHHDAHANNVVYDEDSKTAALIDFGLAERLDPETQNKIKKLHRYMDTHPEEALPINYSSNNNNSKQKNLKEIKTTPVLNDTGKIFNVNLKMFFELGKGTASDSLKALPRLNEWYTLYKSPGNSEYTYIKAIKQLLLAIRNTVAEQAITKVKAYNNL